MIRLPLTDSFVIEHSVPTWSEAVWGVEHGWATHGLLCEIATRHLIEFEDAPREEIELAGLDATEAEQALSLAKRLAAKEAGSEPGETPHPSELWLCLSLRSLYQDRGSYADPLREVEELYAEFDYPEAVEPFVRYMPVAGDYDPGQHTRQENEARLFALWDEFLRRCERKRRR